MLTSTAEETTKTHIPIPFTQHERKPYIPNLSSSSFRSQCSSLIHRFLSKFSQKSLTAVPYEATEAQQAPLTITITAAPRAEDATESTPARQDRKNFISVPNRREAERCRRWGRGGESWKGFGQALRGYATKADREADEREEKVEAEAERKLSWRTLTISEKLRVHERWIRACSEAEVGEGTAFGAVL